MLSLLLDRGADPNSKCGEPGLHQPPVLVAAVEAGAVWAIRQLVDAGADLKEAREHVRRHPLQTTREKTALEALRLIV